MMAAINALNTASTLLQQITTTVSSATPARASMPTLALTAAGVSPETGYAAKSISSAIFNAVTSTSEKQAENIEAVLDFIDRDYTNFDKKFANLYETYGHEQGLQDGLAKIQAAGENLKKMVLSDPSRISSMLEMIKSGRPDATLDGQIGILISKISSEINKNPSGSL